MERQEVISLRSHSKEGAAPGLELRSVSSPELICRQQRETQLAWEQPQASDSSWGMVSTQEHRWLGGVGEE